MNEEKTPRWAIPFGLGSEKLLKILRYIKQKNGNTNYVSMESILTLTSINSQSIRNNISFFTIVGILEGDHEKGFKLTDKGSKLVSSTINGKPEDVKNALLEIIKTSHLNDLKDFIETEGSGISKPSLFNFVKDRGNITDGDRFGNMSAVYSSGTVGLLELFEKAELIPQNLLSKSSPKPSNQKTPPKPKPKPKQKPEQKPELKQKTDNIIPSSESHNLQSNTFSISISKKIEKDELDLIKSQITGFLQFVEKKISNSDNSTNQA